MDYSPGVLIWAAVQPILKVILLCSVGAVCVRLVRQRMHSKEKREDRSVGGACMHAHHACAPQQ